MDVPVSRRKPGWQYRRLTTKPDKRRRSGQGNLPQGASHPKVRTGQYNLGWLPCITPSCVRDANGRRGMESPQVEIIEIPEQPDRTGSPRYQIPDWTDAQLQRL